MIQSCFAETICYSSPSLNGQRSAVKYPGRSGSSVWKNVQGYFLQQPVEMIQKKFHKSIIYHYMDNILLTDPNITTMERLFDEMKKKCLLCWRFQIAPEKI